MCILCIIYAHLRMQVRQISRAFSGPMWQALRHGCVTGTWELWSKLQVQQVHRTELDQVHVVTPHYVWHLLRIVTLDLCCVWGKPVTWLLRLLSLFKPVKPNKAYVILCCCRKWSCQRSRPRLSDRLSDTVELGAGLEVLLAKYFK